jgi:hypothetical protein
MLLDRADLHHDGFQAQVFGPPHRRGVLPLRRARTELGCPLATLASAFAACA